MARSFAENAPLSGIALGGNRQALQSGLMVVATTSPYQAMPKALTPAA